MRAQNHFLEEVDDDDEDADGDCGPAENNGCERTVLGKKDDPHLTKTMLSTRLLLLPSTTAVPITLLLPNPFASNSFRLIRA